MLLFLAGEVEQLRRFVGDKGGGLEVRELRAGTIDGEAELERLLADGVRRVGSEPKLIEALLTEKSDLVQRWKQLEVKGTARRLGEAHEEALSNLHSQGYGFWGAPITSSYEELGIDSDEWLGKGDKGLCSLLMLALAGLGSNGGEVEIDANEDEPLEALERRYTGDKAKVVKHEYALSRDTRPGLLIPQTSTGGEAAKHGQT